MTTHVKITFQSAPPARGATTAPRTPWTAPPRFNPRPPRGGRPLTLACLDRAKGVSIRAPRAGGDKMPSVTGPLALRFQSAPPARGATGDRPYRFAARDVSIRAPRAGGDLPDGEPFQVLPWVSIRAPRAGGDEAGAVPGVPCPVSIRAPRAGGDGRYRVRRRRNEPFQSAPPARGATRRMVN